MNNWDKSIKAITSAVDRTDMFPELCICYIYPKSTDKRKW